MVKSQSTRRIGQALRVIKCLATANKSTYSVGGESFEQETRNFGYIGSVYCPPRSGTKLSPNYGDTR